ncbi:hypothetical protein AQAU111925_06775 [Aquirufa aurantiipilula]
MAAPEVVISNVFDVAPVNPELVADKVYPVAAVLMDKSLNVATPAIAATVFVPDRVPEPAFVPKSMVTLAVDVVKLPKASSILTFTAGLMEDNAAVLLG